MLIDNYNLRKLQDVRLNERYPNDNSFTPISHWYNTNVKCEFRVLIAYVTLRLSLFCGLLARPCLANQGMYACTKFFRNNVRQIGIIVKTPRESTIEKWSVNTGLRFSLCQTAQM